MPGVYTVLDKTAEIVAQYNLSGQPALNVFYIKGTAEWDAASLAALAGEYLNWENTTAKAQRHGATTLNRISCIDRSSQFGPRFDQSANVAGTYAGVTEPNNVSLAVSWRTAKRGRRFRGRTFHIGVAGGMLGPDASTISNVSAPLLLAIYTALLAVVWTNGGQMVVAHQVEGGSHITPGSVEPITSVILVDDTVDSMRRRLPGHNRHR